MEHKQLEITLFKSCKIAMTSFLSENLQHFSSVVIILAYIYV